MAFPGTVFNVMIASPSDVPRERVVARDVVWEWNAINAADKQVVLLPIGWETHSSPSMANTAQATINSQVLQQADLLIAIFWTRLGTPTGEFSSGTVEEVERHISTGKPIMIYFSSAPVAPDSIDQKQYSALVEFRESLKARGLVSFFDDIAAFRTDLFRHLSQTVIRNLAQDDSAAVGDLPRQAEGPQLSVAARDLLLEAVRDRTGTIMHARYLGGVQISTNGRNFTEDGSARNVARWEGAISDLEAAELIVARGTKRQVFTVTDLGYSIAESLGVVPGS
jgi:hypothetical protein